MLKAVIFDMDGVLVDSEPLHAQAAVMALKEYGVSIPEDYFYNFIGSTTSHMFQCMIDDFQLNISLDELENTNRTCIRKLELMEGHKQIPWTKELIIDLFKNGVKLAVASSSPLNNIKEVTRYLGISKYFDKLVSVYNVDNPNPAPDIFLSTSRELGVKPSDCIVIEDSKLGTLAAHAAGMISIGFINPNSGNQDLQKSSVLIESFEDINYNFLLNEYLRSKGKAITIATTRRLIIRELTVEDIKSMYNIYQNNEVRKYIDDIDDYLEVEIEKHKAYIKNIYGFYGYGLWGVFSKDTQMLIGRSGIQNREIDGRNEIELSYLLDYNYWGYGYASECTQAILLYAFHQLNLRRIVAVIDQMNERSQKLASKLGMKIEKQVMHNGRICDLYVITKGMVDERM